MEIIENQRFGEERALYHRRGLTLRGCRFAGEEDGESALKECADVAAENCLFDLRYPLWHVEKLRAERDGLSRRLSELRVEEAAMSFR